MVNKLSKLLGVVITNWIGKPEPAPGSSGIWNAVTAIPGISCTKVPTRLVTVAWLASRWLHGTIDAIPNAWFELGTPVNT
ncbi:Uncharacterised protein [Vibrio cholerae]|nr:Uncharacterised protein [Vibrio cholerae]CSC16565.1 Uncharacterised protein [Vibrio cholerae]